MYVNAKIIYIFIVAGIKSFISRYEKTAMMAAFSDPFGSMNENAARQISF